MSWPLWSCWCILDAFLIIRNYSVVLVLTYTALHFSMVSQQWIWTELVHMVDIPYEPFFSSFALLDFLHTGITCSSSCRCRSICTSMQLILGRDFTSVFFVVVVVFYASHLTGPVEKAIRTKWKNQLETQIHAKMGLRSPESAHSLFINSSLFQFKVIHRLHYSKRKLHK